MKKSIRYFSLGIISISLVLLGTSVSAQNAPMAQIPSVESLRDVEPTDWAYEALRSLIEKYNLVDGYPDNTFRGERPLSRYEFAALLKEALDRLTEITETERIAPEDLTTINKLSQGFNNELAVLRGRTDALEARVSDLENTQFSTTAKFKGQVIFAANVGDFDGDRIIAPRGALVSDRAPQATFIYRTALFFNASFQETDLLQIRLVTGSDGRDDNAGGFLEPNFGSTLDYTIQGRDGQISVARVFYQFSPHKDVNLVVGPIINVADYVDNNNFVGTSFLDFSTLAFTNNFVLLPRPLGGGAIVEWNPKGGAFHLRAAYVAGDAEGTLPGNDRLFGGGEPNDVSLFPAGGGGAQGGLFDDPRQGIIEVEYSPTDSLAIRLLYSGGEIFGSNFNGVGVNFDWSILPQLGIFGRYGYSDYPDTTIGDIEPNYWLTGLSFSDLLVEGSLSGIAVGQPFIENAAGDATQTNLEVFYNYRVNDNIRITPLLQVIFDPGNQSSNGTIFSGTVRTVFSF